MRTAHVLPLPAAIAATTRAASVALLSQASAWADFARTRTTQGPAVLLRKALESARFSADARAHALAIPSKLAGTRAHQEAVRALAAYAEEQGARFLPLVVVMEAGALGVCFEDEAGTRYALGFVQPKHVGWVAPLLAHGLRLYLSAVTGQGAEKHTLGVNVVFGHVGPAVASATQSPSTSLVAEPQAPYGACARAASARLFRDGRGLACIRLSPRGAELSADTDGVEWGYAGAGPARLARLLLTYFEGEAVADWLAFDFKTEIVAHVPPEGVTLTAADVRAWVERSMSTPA